MTTPVRSRTWRERTLFHWLLMAAALVLIAVWFLSVIFSGFAAPNWVPATGCFCLIVALWIP